MYLGTSIQEYIKPSASSLFRPKQSESWTLMMLNRSSVIVMLPPYSFVVVLQVNPGLRDPSLQPTRRT